MAIFGAAKLDHCSNRIVIGVLEVRPADLDRSRSIAPPRRGIIHTETQFALEVRLAGNAASWCKIVDGLDLFCLLFGGVKGTGIEVVGTPLSLADKPLSPIRQPNQIRTRFAYGSYNLIILSVDSEMQHSRHVKQ